MFLLPPLTEDVAFLTFEPLFGPSTSSKRSNVSGLGSRYEPYRRPDASSALFSLSLPVGSNHSSGMLPWALCVDRLLIALLLSLSPLRQSSIASNQHRSGASYEPQKSQGGGQDQRRDEKHVC